jgi:hypothetical protein
VKSEKKIYIASKTIHADKWRNLRDEGWNIISTWIDEAGPGESASLPDLWLRCISESGNADVVIVYREPGEVLKGAFIEVGSALQAGVQVLEVGCEEFSFINHPLVGVCYSLVDALGRISTS